ncbi:hypothetical protein F3P51_18695 [Bacteroides fragilis]|uniref:CST complex subunit Stn1 N-terminal domain-containing protein n=1 Tax=Bacteroides fragilis TaxID=817 RepID=A0A642KNP2_BACFG|nr:hypothetical protein F2Z40_23515 [Bacteroides fragilis]KAA5084123.1 hypothetical protein F2Z82_20250 [Bacteroides fragilis]KAA5088034.1 hypothetical protein F2Z45_17390 [Bacteroides fragilis]KAA5096863.1 hypothetical protein F2Z46_19400 [Bacteroides fragilis]KAA5101127.1 hypothetical protein F2Z51_17860 [Bacteroides fragilis]
MHLHIIRYTIYISGSSILPSSTCLFLSSIYSNLLTYKKVLIQLAFHAHLQSVILYFKNAEKRFFIA